MTTYASRTETRGARLSDMNREGLQVLHLRRFLADVDTVGLAEDTPVRCTVALVREGANKRITLEAEVRTTLSSDDEEANR